jgi:hypothetical protein
MLKQYKKKPSDSVGPTETRDGKKEKSSGI